MKRILPALGLSALVLLACKPESDTERLSPSSNSTPAPAPAPAPAKSASYVVAQPLPGRKLKVFITAQDRALYIDNCNAHITLAMIALETQKQVWGGASDACLSPSIIVPQGATLSLVQHIAEGYAPMDTQTLYQVQVFPMHYGSDRQSAKVSTTMATSNAFRLLP